MISPNSPSPRPYKVYLRRDLDKLPQLQKLSADDRLAMRAVAAVLPFRVNNYVVEELIDWDNTPADPMFQLTFPQRGMLDPADLEAMMDLLRREAPADQVNSLVRDPEAFRRHQTLTTRIFMRLTSLFNLGPFPVYVLQMNASRGEVLHQLDDALDAVAIASVRDQRLLDDPD